MLDEGNKIGDIGELLLSLFLTQKTREGYLFNPLLIGGKWPTMDIYAEISRDPGKFCFFQVKTTLRGYSSKGKLQINVPKIKLERLARYHAPSYLVGIDLKNDNPFHSKAYIAAVRGAHAQGMHGVSTRYELTEENLIRLRDEVEDFWDKSNLMDTKTVYRSIFDI
ncbi:MAG: hypothetical protein KGS48_12355 [Bacteroidetes bacterium]|nr:hypothetical protein [Bacteroidota bacterium]